MPKLLIATTVPVTIEAFLLPYVRHFRALGWTVEGVAQGLPGSMAATEFDRVHDVEWNRDLLSPSNVTTAVRSIAAILQRGRYDLVHTHTAIASMILRFAASQMPQPERPAVIYTAHGFHFNSGGNFLKRWTIRQLEKWACRHTDFLVTINREDELAACSLMPRSRVVYMPGIGVDSKHYSPESVPAAELEHVRQALDLPTGASAAVMIAEFSPRKRHADLVRALARMQEKNFHLILVGAGSLVQETQKLAAELGVLSRVHFTGFQREVRPFLLLARCAVLCSSLEGLPRSLMEAMSCGLPAIGTEIRGTRDLLESGCGLLYPVGDVAKLAGALDWMAAHPDHARRLGQRGRDSVRAYAIEELLTAHEHLFARALASRAGRRGSRLLKCAQEAPEVS